MCCLGGGSGKRIKYVAEDNLKRGVTRTQKKKGTEIVPLGHVGALFSCP